MLAFGSNQVMASFLQPNLDILRYNTRHPTSTQLPKLPAYLRHILQNGVRSIDPMKLSTTCQTLRIDVNGRYRVRAQHHTRIFTDAEAVSSTLRTRFLRTSASTSKPTRTTPVFG